MPIAAFHIKPDGHAEPISTPEEKVSEGYVWVHFDRADPELTSWLKSHVPSIPSVALLQDETRPRCDQFEDGLILNLRGVNMNEGHSTHDMVSLRMWATERLLVSVRVRRVFAAEDLTRLCQSNQAPPTVGLFLYTLISRLGDRIETEVTQLSDSVDETEEQIYGGQTQVEKAIGPMRQSAIKLRRYLAPQREALNRMLIQDSVVISEKERIALREPVNRSILSVEELDALKDRLDALQQHHDATVATRLGKNSYVLSIVAAIFLPLGFLTGLFGVNVAGMPGIEWPWAFAAVSLLCFVIGVALLLVFRWVKWL